MKEQSHTLTSFFSQDYEVLEAIMGYGNKVLFSFHFDGKTTPHEFVSTIFKTYQIIATSLQENCRTGHQGMILAQKGLGFKSRALSFIERFIIADNTSNKSNFSLSFLKESFGINFKIEIYDYIENMVRTGITGKISPP